MKECLISLTEEERNRIATIISYNCDMNIEPAIQRAMKDGLAKKTAQLFEIKKADQAIMMKILGTQNIIT